MKKDHIFVQCASYRDPELRYTIRTAFNNAEHPERLRFGICWQGKIDELKEQIHPKSLPQCRTVLIEADSAQGIGYARYKAHLMHEEEEYYLQIDSHMKFLPGWDTMCIEMLNECESNKPFLTAYFTDHRAEEDPGAYRLAADYFDENDKNLIITGLKVIEKAKKPVPGILASAHFVFSKSEMFEEAPPDPNLQFLFEETVIAPKCYTYGWDIFYPYKAPLQHRWGRNYRNTNWPDDSYSGKVYRQLRCIEPGFHDFGKFRLGKKRTLEEYERYSGISFKDQTIAPRAKKGLIAL